MAVSTPVKREAYLARILHLGLQRETNDASRTTDEAEMHKVASARGALRWWEAIGSQA